MRRCCYLLLMLIALSISVFMTACDFSSTQNPPQEPQAPSGPTEPTTPDGDEDGGVIDKAEEDEDDGEEDESDTEYIYFASSSHTDSCYIVYGGVTDFDAAIALRSAIANETGVLLTANTCILYDVSTTPELIIGLTNRENANKKIAACISDIGVEREYFLFVQAEDDLIFYATSKEAYQAGVEAFPAIFLKDGKFSCTVGYKYIGFLQENE